MVELTASGIRGVAGCHIIKNCFGADLVASETFESRYGSRVGWKMFRVIAVRKLHTRANAFRAFRESVGIKIVFAVLRTVGFHACKYGEPYRRAQVFSSSHQDGSH